MIAVRLAFFALLAFAFAKSDELKYDDVDSLRRSLPPPVAIWPLTKQFGTNDANSNSNTFDGSVHSDVVLASDGPFGSQDSSYATGANKNSYLEFPSPEDIAGPDQSFTISLFVRVTSGQSRAPFLEFHYESDNSSDYYFGLNLWMWPNETTLVVSPKAANQDMAMPCSFKNWTFVGVIYHSIDETLQIFCNSRMSRNQRSWFKPLVQTKRFLVGKSFHPAETFTAGRVAGLSIYKGALTADQLEAVKVVAKFYANEPCQSSKCVEGTCKPVGNSSGDGFTCKCTSGTSEADCIDAAIGRRKFIKSVTTLEGATENPETTFSSSSTETSVETTQTRQTTSSAAETTWQRSSSTSTESLTTTTTTVAAIITTAGSTKEPNQNISTVKANAAAGCLPGWTGLDCQTAICTPPCEEGLVCAGGNVCMEGTRVIVAPTAMKVKNNHPKSNSPTLKREYIVIMVFGVIFLIIMLVIIACVCKARRKGRKDPIAEVEVQPLTASESRRLIQPRRSSVFTSEPCTDCSPLNQSDEVSSIEHETVTGRKVLVVTYNKRRALVSDSGTNA